MCNVSSMILTSILKLANNDGVGVQKISESARVSKGTVKNLVIELAGKNLLNFKDETIWSSGEQKLQLALEILKMEGDPESVCKCLNWSEFEGLTELVLKENDYTTVRNLRFKSEGKRVQIDVVGLYKPFILAIDCKHWKRSWRRAATKRVVEEQIRRVKKLGAVLHELKEKLKIKNWSIAKIVPIILTLSDTPFRIYLGVPVVPIFVVQDFLLELHANMPSLSVLTVKTPRL